MKRTLLVLSLAVSLLSACGMLPADGVSAPPATIAPELPSETATLIPAAESPVALPTEGAANPKLPGASFEAQTYVNEAAGFALDYPAGWVVNELAVGPRGTQIQFLSAPELADVATLPEGATRVSATIYQWDPKNDLDAYVANRKMAWEASGFQILEEESLMLDLGLPAVRFTVQTPEAQAIFLFAALGDQYLEVSGEGNLELVREIVQRVRPISLK